jgi:hypothetical protein
MPFDGRGFDVGPPSLRTLADVLRDRSRWPKGIPEWDYRRARTCAIALAALLWPERLLTIGDLADKFGLSMPVTWRLFFDTHGTHGIRASDVTPHHVADAIDAYLATVPKRR